MSKQITVGYDGSGRSGDAVMWAADEAAVRGARLRIVSCYEIPLAGVAIGGWAATEAFASLMEATESSLFDMRAVISAAHPELEIATETSSCPAATMLIDHVAPDDLVVVGASSHDGFAALLLGNTPRHVVRHGRCPVVVVRGPARRGRPDRIVVGVDGSPASDEALRWAGDEADRHGVNLLVVHGWSYPYLPNDDGSREARDLINIDAACVVERAVETAREEFAADVTGRLIESSPVRAILDAVSEGDLLVLGSRGRGAMMATLFGSTVNNVLDHCSVPVVVVRGVVGKE